MTSKRKETSGGGGTGSGDTSMVEESGGGGEAKKMTTKASLRAGSVDVYLEDFFDTFCMHQDGGGGGSTAKSKAGRYLANIFYLLPSAKTYPDYYEVIKTPIDLKQVAQKIVNSTYKTLKQMETDLVLMTDNAKRYNDPKSIVYKDAHKLKTLTKDLYQELSILMQQGKPYVAKTAAQQARTREKKRELIKEIAELTEDDFNKMLANETNAKTEAAEDETTADEEDNEEEDDDDEEEDESEEEEVNTTTASTSRRSTSVKVENTVLASMNTLYEFVKDIKYQGVSIIDPFMRLPSKRVYPDYYEEIKKPISMTEIQKGIKKGGYGTLKSLVDDFVLMCKNAMTYNIEESLIYTHAKHILVQLQKKSEELHQSLGLVAGDFSLTSSPAPKKPKTVAASASASASRQRQQHVVEHNIKRLLKLLLDYCGGEEAAVLSSLNKHGTGTSSTAVPGGRNHDKVILSANFMHLPARDQQPDYYEKIREPIDFETIQKRVDANGYASEAELVADCRRCLENAKAYYSNESSSMYKDAVKLDAYLTHRYQLLMSRQKLDMSDSNLQEVAEAAKRGAGSSSSKAATAAAAALPKFADLKEKLVYLYNYLNDYQLEMRELAPPFRHLPSKTEYPDYYNIIKKPIDMTKIWHKINQPHGHTSAFASMDDMCAEFAQMFENACIYNEPSSMIYKDALTMQRALFVKRDEIVAAAELHSHAAPTGDPLDLANRENLPPDYIANAVHELIQTLFDSCMQYQDTEGRVLSETFYELHSLYLRNREAGEQSPEYNDKLKELLTFDMVRAKIEKREYKRLDAFQDEFCQVFNQVRYSSYLETALDETRASDYNFEATATRSFRVHRFSQLFKDAYELQRYFIQKRDELCRNGDLLLTGALNYKFSALDGHIAAQVGAPATPFDEADALLVEARFRALEKKLLAAGDGDSAYRVGQFYYFERAQVVKYFESLGFKPYGPAKDPQAPIVGCVLAKGAGSQLVIQLYLRPGDDEFIGPETKKMRRFFAQEVFKSDLYALLDLTGPTQKAVKSCECIAMKDFFVNEPSVLTAEDVESSSDDASNDASEQPKTTKVPVDMTKEDIFVCESMFSSKFQFFRKLVIKKWCPLALVSGATTTATTLPASMLVKFTKRSIPLSLQRAYEDEAAVTELLSKVNGMLAELTKERSLFLPFYRETIEYDSPPASALLKEKDLEDGEQVHSQTALTSDIDPELMKTAKYYEQLLFDNEPYKLGDYVYVRHQQQAASAPESTAKAPMIVRIDRLWSTNRTERKFYLSGPLFLRPEEIMHEPTRLFYANEVFQELSREITCCLDQIVASDRQSQSKRCCVMAAKRFVSCRPTEIPEQDVYVCEAKYSLQHKTFRKFTKGLRRFELSIKCNEDEIYFLRRELQLRKHLSPILVKMNINYDEPLAGSAGGSEAGGDGGDDSTDHHHHRAGGAVDDYWSEMMRDDENSSHSLTLNASTLNDQSMTGGLLDSSFTGGAKKGGGGGDSSAKKMRVKRAKKTGFNMFSKEFRKSLRDSHQSLSFTDMSKEVGNRWRALSDKQRAAYEEIARIETIKEAQKMAAEAKAKEEAAAQQLSASSPKHQTSTVSSSSSSSSMNVQSVVVNSTNNVINHLQAASPHHANHINNILAAQAQAQQGHGAPQMMMMQQQPGQLQQQGQIMTTTVQNGQVFINTANQAIYQNVQQYNQATMNQQQQQQATIVYQQGPNNTLIAAKPGQSPMIVAAYPTTNNNNIQQAQPIQIHQNGGHAIYQQNMYQTAGQQQQGAAIQFAPQQILIQQPQQPAPQQQHLIQPIYEIQQTPASQVRHAETPRQAIHREAYVKYIANLRKQHKHQHSSSHHQVAHEWQTSLDVRPSKFNENNMLPAPTAWVENCTSGNLLKHLVSLRYHLLEDSVNIQKFVSSANDDDDDDEDQEDCNSDQEKDLVCQVEAEAEAEIVQMDTV